MPNWKQHSRQDWEDVEEPRRYPGDKHVAVGCLQRIADALEAIIERLDPGWQERARRKVEADAEREQEDEVADQWKPIDDAFYSAAKRQIKRIASFLPAKERESVRGLYIKVAWLLMETFLGSDDRYSRRPTPDDFENARRATKTFDPLTFSWDSVSMGPASRRRLENALDAARRKGGG